MTGKVRVGQVPACSTKYLSLSQPFVYTAFSVPSHSLEEPIGIILITLRARCSFCGPMFHAPALNPLLSGYYCPHFYK